VTSLTSVCDLLDLPRVNCLTHVPLGHGAASQFLVCLELFCKALCRVFLPCGLCFGSALVPGPRGVTEALWNTCAAAIATGLTGSVHQSDRCHRSDRLSGHLYVICPYSSSTVVQTFLKRLSRLSLSHSWE
jgi:hypothetical protein